MQKPKSFFRVFTETGPLVALAVAIALLIGIAGPASAQFFNFGGFGAPPRAPAPPRSSGGWFGGDFFAPFQQQQQQAPQAPRQDFSRAPAPAKRDTVPERNVLVLGDAMADWLAYGLEDVYAEQPDMGVIRKHKTVSGLIKYQPKGEPADWAAAAKGILATEKPDAIVVMLGLNDRVPMREPAVDKSADKKGDKKDDKKDARAKPGDAAKPAPSPTARRMLPPSPTTSRSIPNCRRMTPPTMRNAADVIAPEKSARSPNGLYRVPRRALGRALQQEDRRDDRRAEIQGRAGGVGRPARDLRSEGNGGYAVPGCAVSRCGRQGRHHLCRCLGWLCRRSRPLPVEGSRLRRPDPPAAFRDGVYFTERGARKLAHYVEREVTRLLASRSGPIALPTEPATPDANAVPGQPAPRPLAGPILPLVASSVGTDQLLGGPGSRPAAVDALAARTLVKGEPLAAPAGRADDFAWPRREIGREQAKGEYAGRFHRAGWNGAGSRRQPPRRRSRKSNSARHQTGQPSQPALRDFFGFGTPPRQIAPPPPPAPPAPGAPRPPGNVGRAAEAPAGRITR